MGNAGRIRGMTAGFSSIPGISNTATVGSISEIGILFRRDSWLHCAIGQQCILNIIRDGAEHTAGSFRILRYLSPNSPERQFRACPSFRKGCSIHSPAVPEKIHVIPCSVLTLTTHGRDMALRWEGRIPESMSSSMPGCGPVQRYSRSSQSRL